MALSKYGGITGSKKISEDFENINDAFNKVAADVDTKAAAASPALTGTPTAPTQPAGDNSTKIATTQYADRAAGTVKTDLDTHVDDKVAHLAKEEHDKLTGIESGAQKNQNAFSKVNGLQAATPTDGFSIVGDVGIDVTTNPIDKSIHLTVNGDSAPGKHGPTHDIGGSDPIPGLVQAVTDSNDAKIKANEALSTAQAAETAANQYTDDKVSPIQSSLSTHTTDKVHSAEVHGLRVQADKFQFQNDTGAWQDISGGLTPTTGNVHYRVDPVDGNDANDGLSETTAWKTIDHAIKVLQSMLINHTVNLSIKPGTYDDKVDVTNIFGSGYLTVSGLYLTNQPWSKVKSISIKGCVCRVRVRYFELTASPEIELSNNVGVELEDVLSEVSGSYGVIAYRSKCTVRRCTFSNKGTAIRSADESTIYSDRNSGTNNTRGLEAMYGGEIMKDGSQPNGSTAESKWAGGQIWS